MLPKLKQRLLMTLAVLVGGLCWLQAASAVMPGGGMTGITLIDARAGFVLAVVLILLSGAPAVLLGAGAAAMANPLAGVFVTAASLWMLAAYGGDSREFLWRVSSPASAYLWLLVELAVWTGLYALLLMVMSRSRLPLRRRMPALISRAHQTRSLTREVLRLPTAMVCIVTTIFAGGLCMITVKDTDAGQVLGALALSFTLAGLLGHLVVPGASAMGVLLSPLLLATTGYIYVMIGYDSHDALHAAWYAATLPGLAWTLPIHYASAGVVGSTMGIGLAQALDAAKLQTTDQTA